VTFDRNDFDKREKKETVKDRPLLEEIVRAAPKMELLTGSEEWDSFLTYLQAALDMTLDQLEYNNTLMLDPNSWDNESLMKTKMNLLRLREKKEVLEFVMTMPKELIQTGEIARNQLMKSQEDS